MDKEKIYDKMISEHLAKSGSYQDILDVQKKALVMLKEFNLKHYGVEAPNWNAMTFKERIKKGYCLPFIKSYDIFFTKRHLWWDSVLQAEEALNVSDIPKINHESEPNVEALQMITECLKFPLYSPGERFRLFVAFVAHALGVDGLETEVSGIPEVLTEHFYRNLDVFFLERKVFDHLRYIGEIYGYIHSVEDKSNRERLARRQSFEFRLSDELIQHQGFYKDDAPVVALNSASYVLGMTNHLIGLDAKVLNLTNSTADLIKQIHLILFAPQVIHIPSHIQEQINTKKKEKNL